MKAGQVGGYLRSARSFEFKAGFGLLLSLGLVLALSGCAAPLDPVGNRESGSLVTPIVTSPEPVQSLDEESSCVQLVFEPERSAILGEALADPQLQAVRQQLEARGLTLQAEQARIFQIAGTQELAIVPFGEDINLVWHNNGTSASAFALIRQGQKTLNLTTTSEEKPVKPLNKMQVRKMLRQLREKPKFQAFEERLKNLGHKLDDVRVRAAIDETGHRLLMGLAVQGEQGDVLNYALVMEAQPDGADWALTEDKEPQAGLCAQAQSTGLSGIESPSTVVAQTGSGSGSGYYYDADLCLDFEDPHQIYLCLQHAYPKLAVNKTSLSFGQITVNQSKDLSFIVSNSGGGTLTGTVSGSGICSIGSGGSFSLGIGASQSATVRCRPTATGSFSVSLPVTSNGGNKTVTATGTGILGAQLQVTPTSLNFGIVAVGGTNDLSVTVKNIGDGTLTGSVTAAAPYSIVSGGSFSLAAGVSQSVMIRFSPTAAGSFAKSLSVSSNGGSAAISAAGVGEAVNLVINPPNLDFPIAWTQGTFAKNFTVKNLGQATVTVTVSVNATAPYSVEPGSSFILTSQQSQEVTVTFRPVSTGIFENDVTVSAQGIAFSNVGVHGPAISAEDYFEAQAIAYNSIRELGGRPSLLLPLDAAATHFALMEGFPQLTGEEVRQLMVKALQTPSPTSVNLPNVGDWDVGAVRDKFRDLVNCFLALPSSLPPEIAEGCPNASNTEAARLNNMIGMIPTKIHELDPLRFSLVNLLMAQKQATGVNLWDLFKAIVTDQIPHYGEYEELFNALRGIFIGWTPADTLQHEMESAANVLLAAFVSLMSKSQDVGSVLNSLTDLGDPSLQLYGIVGMVVASERMAAENINVPAGPDALFSEFLKKLNTGLAAYNAYRTSGGTTQSWSRFILDYLMALIEPKLMQKEQALKNDIYANLAASLITYVSLATSTNEAWQILATPAATCELDQNGCGYQDDFVHIQAMKLFNGEHWVVGLFHTEAKLTATDLLEESSHDLLGRIERLSDAIMGNLPYLSTYLRENNPSIFIVAYSIDSNQTPMDLKSKLEYLLQQGRLKVPVYVIYVDNDGYVRGYCVGPTGTCSEDVLNQTAIDLLGVGLNQLSPTYGQPAEQPVDESIITSPLCSSAGQCLVP